MKRKPFCSATPRVSLATAIGLFATVALAVLPGPAEAATEAELTELIRCTNGCRSSEGSCSGECCGRIFCKKSCLGSCAQTRIACEEGCYDQVGTASSGAFFETASLSGNGRLIQTSGPLQCPEGAIATISVTVSQSPGIIARGQSRVACPAGEGSFTVRAVARSKTKFHAPSTATACAVAQIRIGARDVDALQWCRDLSVLPGGVELED
jgi:hypothetical protein